MANGPDLWTRVVTILKVGLPLFAVGMLSAMFLIPADERISGAVQFSKGDIAALGQGLRVSNPVLSGTTTTGDTFRFTAEMLIPDAAPPKKASIEKLAGEMTFKDGLIARLNAATADLDLVTHQMHLSGAVRVETSDGYTLRADRMSVDLKANALEADTDVATEGPMGRITSGTLRVAPAGDGQPAQQHLFSFGNGVRLIYDAPPDSR